MTEILLRRELEPAAQQQYRVAILRRLTRWWLALIALALAALILQQFIPFPAAPLFVVLGGVLVLAGIGWASSDRGVDYRRLARSIAERNPDLHALLLTAIEQERDPATGRLSFLQERVLNEALAEVRRHHQLEAVPRATMTRAHILHALALVVFLGLLLLMPNGNRKSTIPLLTAKSRLTVTPGNIGLEKGNGLVVLATFEGQPPNEATLVVVTNGVERRIPLTRNLNDPVFGGSIPEVTTPLQYRVESSSARSDDFTVTVFEHPRLERADAAVTYPAYTGLEPKKINDTRRVSAVEGSRMDLSLQLNKPVRSATLIGKDSSIIALATVTNRAQATLAQFTFERSQAYQLQLVDADGRTNKIPAQFVFDALTNQRPTLKMAAPRGDQRVSSLQEVWFRGEAQDDFGLRGWGLTYSVAGSDEKTITLGGTAPAHAKTNFAHLLRLEELGLKPDQLISYFIWAEDFGPDGQLRRTASDMFFAEIRPFEEIFREGDSAAQQQQQQQQQQQGNQSPASKLAELQKQIINATWKLQRTETARTPSPRYLKDAPVVRDSQERALAQAEALQEQLQDLRMRDFAQAAEKQMSAALEQLTLATNSAIPLPKALAAEQAAYQALLKLQSREHQVVQSRQQGGQQGEQRAAQPNQSQLSQLELKRQQDRYETQREAAPQQPQQNREQLEALNRLKELAQRQQDINDRLKDLQTEIQAAKSEKEREELQRELKRLREEQREMLADLDQLRQQMEKSESPSQMAETRQQLDDARQEAERSAQALEQNSVQQALAAGTRAERQLEQMRDDLRKQTSGQFAEEMRQMRSDARDLAEKQQEIGKELQQQNDKPKSLSDAGETDQLASRLGEQKKSVTNLLEQIKRVTEQAEAAEPLLSKQLYDTLRRSSQGSLDQTLSAAEELSRRNFLREAQQFEQRAAREIAALRDDVERAAQSVLGDETESLRTAKRELDQLTSQLQRELARSAATNASLSNALSAARLPGTNAQPAGNRTNEIASAAGSSTNGPNRTRGTLGATNASLAMTTTNGGSPSRFGEGSNSAPNRALASNQPGPRSGDQQGADQQAQQGESGRGPARGDSNAQQTASNAQGGQQPGANAQRNQADEANRGDRLAELLNNQQPGSRERGSQDGGGTRGGPITGEDEFREWSQRLSNVEEMVDRPALRNQLAQARDRARATRSEFKRHSKEPRWDLVQMQILGPLLEVRDRISDELSRRDSDQSLAPIDRDPVPGKYGELVRRYYETLGGSQ